MTLEAILHSDGTNFSVVSPQSRQDINAVKDLIQSGGRAKVNADTESAVRRANQSLGG